MSAALVVDPIASAIAWFYLVTNAARVFTYVPQIVAVWRCSDGARSLSLITWWSWVVSHAAAVAYGALIMQDAFFCVISAINLACCATVAVIASRRRIDCRSQTGIRKMAQLPPPAALLQKHSISAR